MDKTVFPVENTSFGYVCIPRAGKCEWEPNALKYLNSCVVSQLRTHDLEFFVVSLIRWCHEVTNNAEAHLRRYLGLNTVFCRYLSNRMFNLRHTCIFKCARRNMFFSWDRNTGIGHTMSTIRNSGWNWTQRKINRYRSIPRRNLFHILWVTEMQFKENPW